jgi:protein TonB
MDKRVSLVALVALLGTAAVSQAAPPQQPSKQLSEIVFQNYPPRALAAGEQGPVYFIVKLDDHASPTSCEVTHGSGYPQLDSETCNMIVQYATFRSVLGADGKPTKSTHEGVVYWRIPGTPAPEINPIPVTAATAPEPQICKRTPRAGTLSGFNRQCMTKREWDLATRRTQDHWGEYQGRYGQVCEDQGNGTCGMSGPSGN